MSNLKQRVYANWVIGLGGSRVASLAAGDREQRTVDQKASGIVSSTSDTKLDEMVFKGFGNHYHQSVYLRRANKAASGALKSISVGQSFGRIQARVVDLASGQVLLFVPEKIEFLAATGGTFTETIRFPVLVTFGNGSIRIHVMTMQRTSETWSVVVDAEVRRVLSTISADNTHETVVDCLREHLGVVSDAYIDYSKRAIAFLSEDAVDTYSGALEERDASGPSGKTGYETLGAAADKRKPMREALPRQFNRLLSAKRIYRAEVKLKAACRGLNAQSTLVLHPSTGKVVCRANLKGGDLHGFLATLS